MTPKRPGAVALRQPACTVCAHAPVAMRGVPFCFDCWPGGPVATPPCLRCGAGTGYWTSGLCRRCHRDGNPGVDSCLDCYAWGATRFHHWLCKGCLTYRRQNPTVQSCQACGRTLHVGRWAVCRLCYRQASMQRGADGSLDLDNVGRYGLQLFLADLLGQRAPTRADRPTVPPQPPPPVPHGEQLVLFTSTPDLSAHGRAGLHHRAEPVLAAKLVQQAHEMAAEFGWSSRQIKDTCMGVRIVLGLRDSTADPVKASHVEQLKTLDLPVWTVLKVLAAAGMLEEDRTPALDAWFTNQLTGLPPAMTAEVTTWQIAFLYLAAWMLLALAVLSHAARHRDRSGSVTDAPN